MLLCSRARLIKSLACAAAGGSIVGWRVKNENMQHKALKLQKVMELPHKGVTNNASPPKTYLSCLPLSQKENCMEQFADQG